MDAASTLIILIFFFSIVGTAFHGGNTIDTAARDVIVRFSEVHLPSPQYRAGAIGAEEAIYSLSSKYNKSLGDHDRRRLVNAIVRNCQQYDVNPRLIAALIARESSFRPGAISNKGALGLGQLMPATAESLNISDAFDIEQNVRGTVRYIRLMLDRWSGDPEQVALALASYFQGYNNVRRNGGYFLQTQAYIQDIIHLANSI